MVPHSDGMEVCLHLPFGLALYLSSMDLGSTPSNKICMGHWVTRFALSNEVDTSGMVPMPIWEVGTTALRKMWELVKGVGAAMEEFR